MSSLSSLPLCFYLSPSFSWKHTSFEGFLLFTAQMHNDMFPFSYRGYLKTKCLCSYVHLKCQLFLEKETKKWRKCFQKVFLRGEIFENKTRTINYYIPLFPSWMFNSRKEEKTSKKPKVFTCLQILKICYLPWM